MAKQITAEQVAEAEASLSAAKKKTPELMQEVADLRSAFRAQEEAAGRRNAGHGVSVEDGA